ncbi:hypothetical protein IWQ56_001933 [Coemansia nantahalensis]|nr:hypothetical protein IWQ56_001933 [Coemansia nantahalensis]
MRWPCIAASLWAAGGCLAAGPCRAQNIVDACLRIQLAQLKSCQYDAWQCKCHGQKKILTCYDNCPELEARPLQEIQVEVFCGPLNGKIYDRDQIDKLARAARPAIARRQTHTTSAAATTTSAQPTQSRDIAKSSSSSESRDSDNRSDARGRANYSVLDAAAPSRPLAAAAPAMFAAAAAAAMMLMPEL